MPDILEEIGELFHHNRRARKLILSSVSINSNKINGKIMSISFDRTQKVTATVSVLDQFGAPLPDADLLAFSAASSNTAVFNIANLNATALTVDLVGVAAGSATITFGGTDTNGKEVTLLVVDVSVTEPVLLATTLSVVFSAPVAQ